MTRDPRERGVYQRIRDGKTTWIARYFVGGRERWETAPTRDFAVKLRARRLYEAAERRILPGKVKPSTMTVRQLGAKFMEWAKANKRSAARDGRALRLHIYPRLGRKLIAAVTVLDAERYKGQRKGELYKANPKASAKPTTNATVNREIALLKAMFAKAVRWGLLAPRGANPSHPLHDVALLKEAPGREPELSAAAEVRLLAECGPRLRAIVTFLLHSGRRCGEALGLTWGDFDRAAGTVTVEVFKKRERRRLPFPLNQTARGALEAMRPKGDDDPDPGALVFSTSSGEPYANIRRDFRLAAGRAGLPALRLHDLRHVHGTRLLESGADLDSVRKELAHSTFVMVSRYLHQSPDHMRAMVERLDPPAAGGATGAPTVAGPVAVKTTGHATARGGK
jgi:integrase